MGSSRYSRWSVIARIALPLWVLLAGMMTPAAHVRAAQPVSFAAPRGYVAGAEPGAVATADFNHDGRADAATANTTFDSVSVLLNDGTGGFPAYTTYALSPRPTALATGDLDGDGNADIAVTLDTGNRVALLLGNGDGTFHPGTDAVLNQNPSVIAIGDVNGDGKLDLVVGTRDSFSGLGVLLNAGGGTFLPATMYPTTGDSGYVTSALAFADINGDGKPDIAAVSNKCTNIGGCTGALNILVNNGDGTFRLLPIVSVSGERYGGIAAGDFNGDGYGDIVYYRSTTFSGSSTRVLIGDGDGTFRAPVDYANVVADAAIVRADLNGDSKDDLVTNSGAILYSNGDGTFRSTPGPGTVPTEFGFFAVADLTGDGKPDLLTSQLIVLPNRGDGTLVYPPAAPVYPVGYVFAVQTGDMNGDGLPDVVAATQTGVAVLLSIGGGRLRVSTPFQSAGSNFIALGDVDGDGKRDVIGLGQSAVSVLLGNGDGTLQPRADFSDGLTTSGGLALGDFNRDGKLDIAATNGDESNGQMSIMLGNGDGTFGAPTLTPMTGGTPGALSASRVNTDGDTDLIVLLRPFGAVQDSTVRVLFGAGNGTFPTHTDTTITGSIEGLITGDVNNDGKLDIVYTRDATTVAGGSVTVLLGNGSGAFTASVTSDAGVKQPTSPLLADMDGDGLLDLSISLNLKSSVNILVGNGSGGFRDVAHFYPGGTLSAAVAMADLDGDGRTDLLVATALGVVVLRNTTASNPNPPVRPNPPPTTTPPAPPLPPIRPPDGRTSGTPNPAPPSRSSGAPAGGVAVGLTATPNPLPPRR